MKIIKWREITPSVEIDLAMKRKDKEVKAIEQEKGRKLTQDEVMTIYETDEVLKKIVTTVN